MRTFRALRKLLGTKRDASDARMQSAKHILHFHTPRRTTRNKQNLPRRFQSQAKAILSLAGCLRSLGKQKLITLGYLFI